MDIQSYFYLNITLFRPIMAVYIFQCDIILDLFICFVYLWHEHILLMLSTGEWTAWLNYCIIFVKIAYVKPKIYPL